MAFGDDWIQVLSDKVAKNVHNCPSHLKIQRNIINGKNKKEALPLKACVNCVKYVYFMELSTFYKLFMTYR